MVTHEIQFNSLKLCLILMTIKENNSYVDILHHAHSLPLDTS